MGGSGDGKRNISLGWPKLISDIHLSYFNGVKNEEDSMIKFTRPSDFVCQFFGAQIGFLKKKKNNN